MKMKTIAFAIAAVAAATSGVLAQSTTVIERTEPSVTVEKPATVIEKREPSVTIEKRSVETTGRTDCTTKTVRKEDGLGSTTVRKEEC